MLACCLDSSSSSNRGGHVHFSNKTMEVITFCTITHTYSYFHWADVDRWAVSDGGQCHVLFPSLITASAAAQSLRWNSVSQSFSVGLLPHTDRHRKHSGRHSIELLCDRWQMLQLHTSFIFHWTLPSGHGIKCLCGWTKALKLLPLLFLLLFFFSFWNRACAHLHRRLKEHKRRRSERESERDPVMEMNRFQVLLSVVK